MSIRTLCRSGPRGTVSMGRQCRVSEQRSTRHSSPVASPFSVWKSSMCYLQSSKQDLQTPWAWGAQIQLYHEEQGGRFTGDHWPPRQGPAGGPEPVVWGYVCSGHSSQPPRPPGSMWPPKILSSFLKWSQSLEFKAPYLPDSPFSLPRSAMSPSQGRSHPRLHFS